jgi:hypothetical protein
MVLQRLDALEAGHGGKYRLKEAIADLNPEFHEFEKYIAHVFKAHGYKTKWDQIIQGDIIEHQADVLLEKDGKHYIVECKHHRNPHRMTGLDIPLTYWAILDDIQKGHESGKIKTYYDNMWVITNTKFSMHAIKYAKGKNLILSGWAQPKENDLRELIDSKSVYPLTLLGLDEQTLAKLSNANFILINDIITANERYVQKLTKLPYRKVQDIVNKAKQILV